MSSAADQVETFPTREIPIVSLTLSSHSFPCTVSIYYCLHCGRPVTSTFLSSVAGTFSLSCKAIQCIFEPCRRFIYPWPLPFQFTVVTAANCFLIVLSVVSVHMNSTVSNALFDFVQYYWVNPSLEIHRKIVIRYSNHANTKSLRNIFLGALHKTTTIVFLCSVSLYSHQSSMPCKQFHRFYSRHHRTCLLVN